jgi:hypothetical protein
MKNRLFSQQRGNKGMTVLTVILLVMVFTFFETANARTRSKKAPPPEKVEAIIIGDRVLDIAYNLDVLPVAMSVRGSLWTMADEIKTSSQILGCPMFSTVKKKETIPNALKKFGLKRVIVEKGTEFCLYKPKVQPVNIAPILEGIDVKIEYVDFSQGLESAIRQTAKLLDRDAKADALIEKYNKNRAKAQAKLPAGKLGKKVLIFSGTYQQSTGKPMLRVEAPGGYSDRFFLEPMGCVNVGEAFKPTDGKPDKGHYPVPKKKGGLVLDPLIKANPDVIVMTGSAYAVQKILATYLKNNPALADVAAIKNMAVYHLPIYIDSSVIEFPDMLRQWAVALTD